MLRVTSKGTFEVTVLQLASCTNSPHLSGAAPLTHPNEGLRLLGLTMATPPQRNGSCLSTPAGSEGSGHHGGDAESASIVNYASVAASKASSKRGAHHNPRAAAATAQLEASVESVGMESVGVESMGVESSQESLQASSTAVICSKSHQLGRCGACQHCVVNPAVPTIAWSLRGNHDHCRNQAIVECDSKQHQTSSVRSSFLHLFHSKRPQRYGPTPVDLSLHSGASLQHGQTGRATLSTDPELPLPCRDCAPAAAATLADAARGDLSFEAPENSAIRAAAAQGEAAEAEAAEGEAAAERSSDSWPVGEALLYHGVRQHGQEQVQEQQQEQLQLHGEGSDAPAAPLAGRRGSGRGGSVGLSSSDSDSDLASEEIPSDDCGCRDGPRLRVPAPPSSDRRHHLERTAMLPVVAPAAPTYLRAEECCCYCRCCDSGHVWGESLIGNSLMSFRLPLPAVPLPLATRENWEIGEEWDGCDEDWGEECGKCNDEGNAKNCGCCGELDEECGEHVEECSECVAEWREECGGSEMWRKQRADCGDFNEEHDEGSDDEVPPPLTRCETATRHMLRAMGFGHTTPDVASEGAPDMAPDIAPVIVPDVALEMSPEVAPEEAPDMAPQVTPEMTPVRPGRERRRWLLFPPRSKSRGKRAV